jgi:methylenetetrahydrofolate dehydrogenase (NADP+)/methenyltetrahydrofolate cyclohydrolase
MSANIIDGRQLSHTLRQDYGRRVQRLASQGVTPGLAVLLVGQNPASQVYVKNKVLACKEIGMHSVLLEFEADMTQARLLQEIDRLNHDASIHGILVQLPLPSQIDPQSVIQAISPLKDVDGFNLESAGGLMCGTKSFWPCTPHGCLQMLDAIGFDLKGKHAVVVGRSNIVGKPMALMLLQRNATVTICHSQTADLKAQTLQADVLVAAVGIRHLIKADMVKPGAVVLDVGMNRDEQGKLCGDVDFAAVKEVASYITPVPGGVGPMTITMLLANTLEAAQTTLSTLTDLSAQTVHAAHKPPTPRA